MNSKTSLLAAALLAGVAFAVPAFAEMTTIVGGAPMYPSKNTVEPPCGMDDAPPGRGPTRNDNAARRLAV